MHFDSPEYFLLLPALALIGWMWRGLRLGSPLRALILLLATLMLTGPSIRRQRDQLDLLVLLDRSVSTGGLVDQSISEWQRLLEKWKPSRSDRIVWYNYGAEIAERGKDGVAFTGSRQLTRTGLAVQTLAASANQDTPTRILVFTDGYATEPLGEAADDLAALGIPLDFRLLREPDENDFRLARLDLPDRIQAGEPFVVGVEIRGQGDAEIPLLIRRDGVLLAEKSVPLTDGIGKIEFLDRIPRAGTSEYEVEILPREDAHQGNNQLTRWIEIVGGPKILLVTAYLDDPLAAVLAAQDFEVETVTDPSSLRAGSLGGAKALIINNVPAFSLPDPFLKAVDFFVREQGGGLLMAGGEHSFGAGAYFESPLDPLLPISMELKSEYRKLAVALAVVLDRSGSMSVTVAGGQTKMDLANSGTAKAIDLLSPMDQVTVIPVDSEATLTIPLTIIGKQKPTLINRALGIQSAGGGIYIHNALEAAWKELKKSKAGTRHVILFSDAADSEEPGNYQDLIDEMLAGGCTISVIGLGTDADPDAALLADIARRAGGRIFFSDRPQDIPSIFAQETVTIARSAFIKQPVGTQASGKWSEISPSPLSWLPQVDGYNLSYARPDSTVSLVTTDEFVAPLVAHARRGLGRSMAISFALGGEFSEHVRAWPEFGNFIQTTGRFLMGDELPPGIALRQRLEGTVLRLELLHDEALWAETFATRAPGVRIQRNSQSETVDLDWERIAPGKFSLRYELDPGDIVRGSIRVGTHAIPFGPVTVGSAVEWNFDPARLTDLRELSRRSGGRELTDLRDAWQRPQRIVTTSLAIPLTISLLVLTLIEALAIRTGYRLPEWRHRSRTVSRQKRVKPLKADRPAAAAPQFITTPEPAVQKPTPAVPNDAEAEEAVRRSRFARAKRRR